MCPACLAALGIAIAKTASAGAIAAFVAAKVRKKTSKDQPGDNHGSQDRQP